MSIDIGLYVATANNLGGPIIASETNWSPPINDDADLYLLDEAPSPAVRIALIINVLLLIGFMIWMFSIIF
ncbi:hypothetical protein P7B04_22495 [Sphingobium yanoikuyae]|jgi:hypothetical protein|uniref:hypothetical protein n=1 Tax=Sphingobium yanoikuyae TaxID=13690 RepID=UPI002410496E|nr:hypothetical protein [Sphingobium yanoikuyae]MDG2515454.1 hypothetical protein [Sphingobium yanoikuyae]